jgi:rfaE bifunctional protein kinase chain/domain
MTPNDAARLERIIAGFPGRRVAVLGDLVADEFVYGDIERVSREAPVLVLRHARTSLALGGAGNAVANLRALDARPVPVGVVGTDPSGTSVLDALERTGVDTSRVVRLPGYETPAKQRILAGGVHTRRQQVVRLDRGSVHGELAPADGRRVDESLAAALADAESLLVADYGYGTATPERVEAARAAHPPLPVTVDSRSRVAAFRRAVACTPNQEELERALGLESIPDERALTEAGTELLRRTDDRAVLVTLGSRGMCLFERERAPLPLAAYGSDEVADVTGAGDTVIAVFALSLLAGASFPDAARLANYAAGLVVMKAGTATVSRDELVQAIATDPGARP